MSNKSQPKEIFVRFSNGNERVYKMKVISTDKNGDVRLIDGSLVEKKDIIETIKSK